MFKEGGKVCVESKLGITIVAVKQLGGEKWLSMVCRGVLGLPRSRKKSGPQRVFQPTKLNCYFLKADIVGKYSKKTKNNNNNNNKKHYKCQLQKCFVNLV